MKLISQKSPLIPKLFFIQILPMILALIYIVLLTPEYLQSRITPFSKLGFYSLVEGNNARVVGGRELKQKNVFQQRLFSSENNLGIVLVRFTNFNRYNTDTVWFRIRDASKDAWYYSEQYTVAQFQNNQYFTFGFPIIPDSKGKYYDIEIESMTGGSGNSVGISKIKPQFALVYKFSEGDIKSSSIKTIIRLGWKKATYVLSLIDYRGPFYIYFISVLFILLYAFKSQVLDGIRQLNTFFFVSLKKLTKIKFYNTSLARSYKSIENRVSAFVLSGNYRIFLLISIFVFACSIRILSYLSPENYYKTFFYQLGSGGDYEMFIRHSSTLLADGNSGFWQNWWDWLFITRILAFFYYFFGFIGGLGATELLMILMGSVVALIPYYILSRKHWFSIGGILGSLLLCTNPLLITLSLAYMIDTSAMYLYSLFIAAYFITFERRNLYWLCILGFTALTDGLNKVIWLLNDPLTLIAFIPLFSIKSFQLIPRIRISFESKRLKAAAIPIFVFTIIYCLWELYINKTLHKYYYLGDVFFSSGGGSKDYLYESLGKNVSVIQKIGILFDFSIRAINNLDSYIHIPHIILWMFIGLLVFKLTLLLSKRFEPFKYISIIGFVVALIGYVLNIYFRLPFEKYYIAGLYEAIIILSFMIWPFDILKLLVLIGPYFAVLISVVTTLPLSRLYGQVVLWSMLCLGYILDRFIYSTEKKQIQRTYSLGVLSIILCIFFMFPTLFDLSVNGMIGLKQKLDSISYYRWINSVVPANTVLLSSEGDDLLIMGMILEKPFVFNSRFGSALLITKNQDPTKLALFNFPYRIGNVDVFPQYTYVVTDINPSFWLQRIRQGDDIFTEKGPIYTNQYVIDQYSYSKELKRILYRFDKK